MYGTAVIWSRTESLRYQKITSLSNKYFLGNSELPGSQHGGGANLAVKAHDVVTPDCRLFSLPELSLDILSSYSNFDQINTLK